MKPVLAFVLSGGGSRGALQVGALRALYEAGIQPDLLAGSSVGAANSTFLAVHGYTAQGIDRLARVWASTVDQDLLPTNLWWQLMRALFQRSSGISQQRIRDFAIANGVTPELRFADLQGPRLFLVAADLNAGCPVVFGPNPQDTVLEAVLASMTLPPWLAPVTRDGRYLVDGGFISNLPIEAAIQQGAAEIVALDLFNPNDVDLSARGLRPFIWKVDKIVEGRQVQLELELARARGVHVHHIPLITEDPAPIWDFSHSLELIEMGYQLTRQAMRAW